MNTENPTIVATLLALLAMSSLLIGAVCGIKLKPSKKINATILAFGAGALIQALSLELAHEGAMRLLERGGLTEFFSWAIVAFGFLFGGLAYNYGNKIISDKGGALRHKATTSELVINLKRNESKNNLQMLGKIDLFQSLPAEEIHHIIEKIKTVEFKKNEKIFNQGDKGNALYLIIDGEVEIFSTNEKGKTNKIATLGSGKSFGEMSLLNQEPRSAGAKTKAKTNLWKIERKDFYEILEHAPKLKHAIEKLNQERLEKNIATEKNLKEKEKWQKLAIESISRATDKEHFNIIKTEKEKPSSPTAIFLGAVLDGIPESIIIGASFISFATFNPTFLVAVFLSNFPEAMSSAVTMKKANFSNKRIYSLWGGLVLVGGISAALGNIFFATANPITITLIEAVAGGGILAMLASVMMPEAFEEGGAVVGISTICGFLSAFYFSLI